MTELKWIEFARSKIGLKENTSKTVHNKEIIEWLDELGAWWKDDETPWCGTFVAICLKRAERALPVHWYRAKDYLNYGTKLRKPAYGSIGVMSRKGGGHVTFIIGKTKEGDLVCLGGNQNNEVNITAYPLSRFDGFIWPEFKNKVKSQPNDNRYDLPLYNKNNLTKVTSEA